MTNEELIGETVPTETVAYAESDGESGSDIVLCPNCTNSINDPFCAALAHIILASLGLAATFSVEVTTQ